MCSVLQRWRAGHARVQWKLNTNQCTTARRIQNRDVAAVAVDHLAHQVQPQACACLPRPQPLEGFENPFALVDRYAGAVSFRYRDGTQKNGVPVEEAIREITDAIAARIQV